MQKTLAGIYWNEKQFKVMRAANLFLLKARSCETGDRCETCKEPCQEFKEWSELCEEK